MRDNYLEHYNHNHDRLGRFASSIGGAGSSVGGKVVKKKKTAAPKADIKSGKSANTKLSEADRKRLVESGSAKDISNNKDRLSTRELEQAVNRLQREKIQRIDLEKKLSDLSTDSKKKRTALEKIEKYSSDLERLSNAGEKVMKFYNTAAKTHNLMSPGNDQWPIYGEKKTAKTSDAIKEIMRTGTIEQVKANKGKMSSQEYKEAVDRIQQDQRINQFYRNEHNLPSDKDRMVRSSKSLKDVYKNRDKFTNKEYEEAISRTYSDKYLKDVIDGKMTYEEYLEKKKK